LSNNLDRLETDSKMNVLGSAASHLIDWPTQSLNEPLELIADQPKTALMNCLRATKLCV
jgi:hypothetical protein